MAPALLVSSTQSSVFCHYGLWEKVPTRAVLGDIKKPVLAEVKTKRVIVNNAGGGGAEFAPISPNQYLSLQTGLVALQVLSGCSLLGQLGPHLIRLSGTGTVRVTG